MLLLLLLVALHTSPILTTGTCPRSHPYAFKYGASCCKYHRESFNKKQGWRCDGSLIWKNSLCCLDNAEVSCGSPPCNAYPGASNSAEIDKIPTTNQKFKCIWTEGTTMHPNGIRQIPVGRLSAQNCANECIRRKIADNTINLAQVINLPNVKACFCGRQGERLSESSYKSCFLIAENQVAAVINEPFSTCPKSHPHAYSYGQKCCKYDQEDHYNDHAWRNTLFDRCDGGILWLNSVCCKGNIDTVTCAQPPCSSYPIATNEAETSTKLSKAADAPVIFAIKRNQRIQTNWEVLCQNYLGWNNPGHYYYDHPRRKYDYWIKRFSSPFRCSGETRLNIVYANYGKNSNVYCNQVKESQLYCNSEKSTLKIVRSLCQGKRSCLPKPSPSIFGDPCPGVDKYLFVEWQCLKPNPCDTRNGGCNKDEVCQNKDSQVSCFCKDGMTKNKDGTNCRKAGPCDINNGGCSQICKNQGSIAVCSCQEQYKLNKDGKTCDKQCKDSKKGFKSRWTSKDLSCWFLCNSKETRSLHCSHHPDSFFQQPFQNYCPKTSKYCVDNCAKNRGGCSHICESRFNAQAAICSCYDGYALNADGKSCHKVVDPCTINNGGCTQVCSHQGKTVICSCKVGYTLNTDGKSCAKIDPCATNKGGCSHACSSHGQTVTCSCKAGFTLNSDGKTCKRVDPCKINNGGCSQLCLSAGSMVVCSCKDGFKPNADRKSCDRVCKGVADIGFALDSSGSLGAHYQDEKDFLKSLTNSFGISKDGSHAGVVTFGLKAEVSIRFNQYTTQYDFGRAVDYIRLFNSFTRIDKALKIAKEKLFSVKNGARPNVSKLLVLITDGSQTNMWGAEDPAKIAAEIRAAGIKTIAVGIGSEVKPLELARIAGSPNDAYTAANFDELKKPGFADKVKKAMCPKN